MRYQPQFLFTGVCLVLGGLVSVAGAQSDQEKLVGELKTRWLDQRERAPGGETLRQSHEDASLRPPESHRYVLSMDRGIEIVSEIHQGSEEEIEKNHYLQKATLFAYEVVRSVPLLDKKNKRVEVNRFWFDQGKVVGWETFSKKVASAEKLDLAKMQTQFRPVPKGLDGWSDDLTAYAFDLARGFRRNAGRHAFGDWDEWLLKGAPPEGSGTPLVRPAGWLPAEEVTMLPVLGSTSPTGRYAIAWGYERGPVNWKALAFEERHSVLGKVSFTSKLAKESLEEALLADGNFLWSPLTRQALSGNLDFYHPGERQRFSHDGLIMVWAPAETCFVAITTAKWSTENAALGWIKDGRCERTFDVIEPLQEVAKAAVMKSKHPAARRLLTEAEDYEFRVNRLIVDDDGAFEAKVVGEIPKADEASAFYGAIIEGRFISVAEGESAKIENSKVRVLPVNKDGGP